MSLNHHSSVFFRCKIGLSTTNRDRPMRCLWAQTVRPPSRHWHPLKAILPRASPHAPWHCPCCRKCWRPNKHSANRAWHHRLPRETEAFEALSQHIPTELRRVGSWPHSCSCTNPVHEPKPRMRWLTIFHLISPEMPSMSIYIYIYNVWPRNLQHSNTELPKVHRRWPHTMKLRSWASWVARQVSPSIVNGSTKGWSSKEGKYQYHVAFSFKSGWINKYLKTPEPTATSW